MIWPIRVGAWGTIALDSRITDLRVFDGRVYAWTERAKYRILHCLGVFIAVRLPRERRGQ